MSNQLAAALAASVKGLTKRPEIARALHRVLFRTSHDEGQTATIETSIRGPERNFDHMGVRAWHVAWESGPHDWAIGAAFAINEVLRANGAECYVEPYYSFSLALSTINLQNK